MSGNNQESSCQQGGSNNPGNNNNNYIAVVNPPFDPGMASQNVGTLTSALGEIETYIASSFNEAEGAFFEGVDTAGEAIYGAMNSIFGATNVVEVGKEIAGSFPAKAVEALVEQIGEIAGGILEILGGVINEVGSGAYAFYQLVHQISSLVDPIVAALDAAMQTAQNMGGSSQGDNNSSGANNSGASERRLEGAFDIPPVCASSTMFGADEYRSIDRLFA